jgi:hypothetical protein
MEHDAAILLELLDAIEGDLTLVLHIFLVANKEQNNIWFTLCHDFIVPRRQIVKCL